MRPTGHGHGMESHAVQYTLLVLFCALKLHYVLIQVLFLFVLPQIIVNGDGPITSRFRTYIDNHWNKIDCGCILFYLVGLLLSHIPHVCILYYTKSHKLHGCY